MNIPADMLSRKARGLAVQYHTNLYGNKPYYYHLDAVCQKLSDLGHKDEITLTVGYLHDILEDTDCPPLLIKEKFGQDVLAAVSRLTKHDLMGYGEPKYYDYISQVKSNRISLNVKIADTLCNLEECLRTNDKRLSRYANQLRFLCEGDL